MVFWENRQNIGVRQNQSKETRLRWSDVYSPTDEVQGSSVYGASREGNMDLSMGPTGSGRVWSHLDSLVNEGSGHFTLCTCITLTVLFNFGLNVHQ